MGYRRFLESSSDIQDDDTEEREIELNEFQITQI